MYTGCLLCAYVMAKLSDILIIILINNTLRWLKKSSKIQSNESTGRLFRPVMDIVEIRRKNDH